MAEQLSADIARQNREPLYGTIKSAEVWLLLEYNGVYTNQAWDDARIPDDVKAKLNDYPNGRALLVRQPDQINALDRKISLFVVDAVADTPAVYHIEMQSYTDVLDLDIDAVRAGEIVTPETTPLYVICTNGKRDVCCSKYGVALYNAMRERVHEQVWQASHIGGHRFAGTMYCFPDAICYGFLEASDSDAIISSYQNRELLLDKLRGHAIYDKPAQAAEYYLRRRLGNIKLDGVKVESQNGNQIDFRVNDMHYRVTIADGKPLQVIATTGDETFKEVPQFKLVDIQQLS
ncbi:MAG: sucrase ferredoxin [Chloroflexota bacterium]